MELKGIAILPTSQNLNERLERDLILKLIALKPHTFIIVDPREALAGEGFSIDYLTSQNIAGQDYSGDMGFLDDFHRVMLREKLPVTFINSELINNYHFDTAKSYYIENFIRLLNRVYPEFRLVTLNSGLISKAEALETGRSIREALERSKHPGILVVFSDLIDKPEFHTVFNTDIEANNFESFLDLTPEPDQETDYSSLLIAIGATDSLLIESEKINDSNSFCYLLEFKVESLDLSKDLTEFTTESIITKWQANLVAQRELLRENENFLQKMVRATIRLWLTQRQRLNFISFAEENASNPEQAERLQLQRTGVFVTILKDGRYRGSMGTINPAFENIGEEIVNNTIEAAFFDPQFVPMTLEELNVCTFEVDVLNPLEQVEDISELDPHKYGLIVEQGFKRGVVLPGIKGIETAQDQLEIAKMRAGIDETIDSFEPLIMNRFTVETF